MVEIKQMLVPAHLAARVSYDQNNPKGYIVVHQTGNTSAGANAYMHALLQYNGNSRAASWHLSVDDTVAYQSFSYDYRLWHGSDGRNGRGNGRGIGVESCVNSDGNYEQTIKNTVAVVKWLMQKFNISTVYVLKHQDTSPVNKYCPAQILNGKGGYNWSKFIKLLGGSSESVKESTAPKPSGDNKYSGSIVNYLHQQGIKSNLNNRKNLAVEYGIVDNESQYTGTAKQNTDLLNAMMNDEKKQEGTRKEPLGDSDYKGNSLVDYLASINQPNSLADRAKLAKEYLGLTNYKGRADQNTDLLNALRSGDKKGNIKSTSVIAQEVIDGKWGNNPKRAEKLSAVGYNPVAIQKEVNRKVKSGGSTKKSTNTIVQEVIDGKWGNGNYRASKLRNAGHDPKVIQKKVNEKLTGKTSNSKSIATMAKEVIDGKHGNGHAQRRKSLGVSEATYKKVRAEVNRRS